MKVLDLACPNGHVFEGWFASEDDYQSQRERQLIECPFCGSHELSKRLSAPRLNLKAHAPSQPSKQGLDAQDSKGGVSNPHDANREASRAPASPDYSVGQYADAADAARSGASESASELVRLQAAWLAVARQIIRETRDVGDQFVSRSRQMHYGEIEPQAIRGIASPDEAQELRDEGIDVVTLPLPQLAKETLQ